ncbi:O-antigen ligase family protein [Altererythrobacter sp. ZODW24]|uniref:O-antigen ligase family protein n=1 Tax=Altererythrobacter sp. ZODW24 TaxID=2185142 RepID=UPI0013B3E4C6|nr:O-antigen ligase family protein [Altererythrobacter sp. ZODW24]
MIFEPSRSGGERPIPRTALFAAALVLALPLLQLVPLPPSVWQSLPGREPAQRALALVGAESEWRAWSLFPGRTLAGLMAVIPAAVMLLAVSRLDPAERRWIAPAIAVTAILSILLGAMQLAGGPGSALRFYSYSNPGFLNGFQANRNAQADILLIGLIAGIVSLASFKTSVRKHAYAVVAAAFVATFALAIVLTGSRAGIALLLPASITAAAIWFGWSRRLLVATGLLALIGAAGASFISGNGRLRMVAERFSFEGEVRQELWADAVFAIGQYWPFGAGVGSASPVLIAAERLEVVDATRPNRVHNDYLEIVLEGGIFAIAMACCLAALIIWKVVHRLRNTGRSLMLENYLAISTLVILALHSIVDYPLRSMSLAMLGAMAVGALLGREVCGPNGPGTLGNEE